MADANIRAIRSVKSWTQLYADITVECPHDNDLTDTYDIVVQYRSREHAVEYGSFAKHLDRWEGREIDQEHLTQTLCHNLGKSLKPLALSVTTYGEHYGIQTVVNCSL